MTFSVASFSELPFSSTKATLSLTCSGGSYTFTGQSATFQLVKVVNGGAGSYSVTGYDAGFLYSQSLPGESGAYTLTGQDAGYLYSKAITAEAGAYSVTGQSVEFDYDQVLTAEAGSYELTGGSASFAIGKTLSAGTFQFQMTGQQAWLLKDAKLDANSGAYVITGGEAEFGKGKMLIAAKGSYSFTGFSADLVYSGGPAVVVEAKGGLPKTRKTKLESDKEQREELEAIVKREFDILDGTYVPEVVEAVKQKIIPQIQQIDWTEYQIALAQVNELLLKAKIQMAEYESELDDEESLLMLL